MASTIFHPCPQSGCNRGAITTMVGKIIGRASNGCEVRSKTFLVPSNAMCPTCNGRGRVTVDTDGDFADAKSGCANAQPKQPITYYGQLVDAPGFTQDQFDRAMARAFCDDPQVKPYHDGPHIVHHVGCTGGYVVTRTSCDCPAGTAGTSCKHRAFLIACLDVREPYIRREWAALNAERPDRKAVAA